MRRLALIVLSIFIISLLTGCQVSKPYVMTTERTDQKMDIGNRGYLKGTPPPPKDRGGLKRPLIAVDIDLPTIEGEKAVEEAQSEERRAKSEEEAPQAAKRIPLKEEEVK